MERKLTAEQQRFIDEFNEANRHSASSPAVATKEVQVAKREHRSLVLFISWISFLVVTPFILSGVFLYQMAQFNTLFQDEVIGGLLDEGKTFGEIVTGTPLEGMDVIYELYENRVIIVGAIFTVFILLIAVSFITRLILSSLRKKK